MKELSYKQEKFYDDNPKAFWIHSSMTLILSGFTFVKTLRKMNTEIEHLRDTIRILMTFQT